MIFKFRLIVYELRYKKLFKFRGISSYTEKKRKKDKNYANPLYCICIFNTEHKTILNSILQKKKKKKK